MVKVGIKAKIKETGEYLEHKVNLDSAVYEMDNDSLYDFVYEFLTRRHGDIFMWFRFWTLPS